MLLEAARPHARGLAAEPRPFVLQKLLGDFAVNYELNVDCDDSTRCSAHYTALHRNILECSTSTRSQIMTPAYEADPPEPKVVPKSKWYLPPAAPDKG